MILVDTSAWIEYLRGTGSDVHRRLAELIGSPVIVTTTEPVDMELLAGARDNEQEKAMRRVLAASINLSFDPVIDFDGAAAVYRECRRSGVTPRNLIDCAIAYVAIRHDAAVLAQDIDFARIAGVVPLELDPATPR